MVRGGFQLQLFAEKQVGRQRIQAGEIAGAGLRGANHPGDGAYGEVHGLHGRHAPNDRSRVLCLFAICGMMIILLLIVPHPTTEHHILGEI
jgi:hypothetical protein